MTKTKQKREQDKKLTWISREAHAKIKSNAGAFEPLWSSLDRLLGLDKNKEKPLCTGGRSGTTT